MLQRFLDPAVLAGISDLGLVAKTVVDGFIAGLHRSPDFGFSQEFAEYRAYNPGDDLRHVDWNVFARTERMYLKRYRGETNCQVTILLDASRSMKFGSHRIDVDPVRAELHRPAGVEQNGDLAIGLAAVALEIHALGSRKHVPIDVPQIVAGIVGAVFGELLAEAEIGRAVQ